MIDFSFAWCENCISQPVQNPTTKNLTEPKQKYEIIMLSRGSEILIGTVCRIKYLTWLYLPLPSVNLSFFSFTKAGTCLFSKRKISILFIFPLHLQLEKWARMKYLLKKRGERLRRGHQNCMHFQAGWTLRWEWTSMYVVCVCVFTTSGHMWGRTSFLGPHDCLFHGLNLNYVKRLFFWGYICVCNINTSRWHLLFHGVVWLIRAVLHSEPKQSNFFVFFYLLKINILWYVLVGCLHCCPCWSSKHISVVRCSDLFWKIPGMSVIWTVVVPASLRECSRKICCL